MRKYVGILKNAGYHFDENKGQRWYRNEDVIVLKRFIEVKNNRDMTLEQSANAVMTWFEQSDMSPRDMDKRKDNTRYNNDIKELQEQIDNQNELLSKQTELIKTLIHKMDEQQKFLDTRIEERDQKLIEVIRLNQAANEEVLQLAAAQEEKETKKGFLAKLFGK
ncbi:hypothetical protein IHV10_22285 [Fictibacillus sp. 5RED26]|uniref:hypothetical protein n=1 Tax=Fictibacillus sp. 5RED26 TaxID=2745876 RepID=UPI0018CE37A1|nr:hypothetical protein [Fictibacillus sp. 5RED26]MBH0159102.1 hypothetical protein [Fictibacillus sp. 5RED26]